MNVKTIKEINKELNEKQWYRFLKVLWGLSYIILSILVVIVAVNKRHVDNFEVLLYFGGFTISYLGITVVLKRTVYYIITGKVFLKELNKKEDVIKPAQEYWTLDPKKEVYALLLIALWGIFSIFILFALFFELFRPHRW